MAMDEPIQELEPDYLPRGTVVGRWRILGGQGRGSYGATYRVERVGEEGAGLFVLKLALNAEDPRFEREAELLRRIDHPSVPRLEGRGQWAHAVGPFPYVVMDWVGGVPLYQAAREHHLSSRQALRWLSQVAWALAATHGAHGVHRDVKGDNVLVRSKDSRAMLVDFGAGDFLEAGTLTGEGLPPGTRRYRSPEALRFEWHCWGQSGVHYEAGPADDVYALGVTAWRLVTGTYPPLPEPSMEAEQDQALAPRPWRVPPEEAVTVCPELAALIHQMVSEEPSARGSATQVAEALERAAETVGPDADQPITRRPPGVPAERKSLPAPPSAARVWRPWLAMAAGVAALLVLYGPWASRREPVWQPSQVQLPREQAEDREDAGTSLARQALMSSERMEQPDPSGEGIRVDLPETPLPGQARPPCKRSEREINGACWGLPKVSTPPCQDRDFEWQGGCYYAVMVPTPPATSEQP